MAGKSIKTNSKFANGILGFFMNAMLILFSLSCIFPLIWMFYSSLKTKREFYADVTGLPENPTFQNFIDLLSNPNNNLLSAMLNSVRTTFLSVVLIVMCGYVLGYILSRIKFKGNRIVYVMLLMGMLIPVHALLVPVYIVYKDLNLSNQWFTLIIPYVAFGLPIAVFLVEGYIKAIPIELEEAAAIDGSSFSKTLFSIILPVSRPILVTIAIIQTFACWNEFSFALILIKDSALQTVPPALTMFKGQFSSDFPKTMAALLITMSPIVVLYFAFSKQIIKGMVAGAVKG
jgi:raffinose/stachyose/melibiose transport system permease protein